MKTNDSNSPRQGESTRSCITIIVSLSARHRARRVGAIELSILHDTHARNASRVLRAIRDNVRDGFDESARPRVPARTAISTWRRQASESP